jgi:manganese efflux pump family protein
VPLGLDTLAVSAALGVRGVDPRRRLRTSLVFSAFEAGMPLVGLGLGRALGTAVGSAAAYVAIALLAVAGLAMLREEGAGEGATALALGLSVSLDELAIGFALGLLHVSVWLAVVLIAAQAFVLAQVGMRAGSRIGSRLRDGAERLAGVALIGLAATLFIERVA